MGVRILLLTLLAFGVASGHAALESSEPAAGATLDTAGEHVVLHFTEGIEAQFGIFKVYPLDDGGAAVAVAPAGAAPATAGPLEGAEALRVNGLAGALVADVLLARGDEDARADTGVVSTSANGQDVTLGLRPGLPPGDYVVMWRALSADTHTVQGYFVFRVVAPAP